LSGNQLSVEALNSRRREAVQLRLQGSTLAQVALQTGLSAPTIIAAVKAFKTGGWAAVNVSPHRGRPSQQLTAFSLDVETGLLKAMLAADGPALWSVSEVETWLAAQGAHVSRSGILRWCQRQGLYDPDQQRPTRAHADFFVYSCQPRLSAAQRTGLPEPLCNRIAVDARGTLRWRMRPSQMLDATEHLALLASLRALHAGPLTLVMAGAEALARVPAVRDWLALQTPAMALHEAPATARSHDTPALAPGATPLQHPTPTPNTKSTAMTLTHLQRLEAESIHIMREVVAEADNPVMLYSVGKDSAVMLHLAMKAFYPSKPPFKLLHVDTRWKFREMYTFRDRMVKELGLELLVHINPDGIEKDINPFTHGSAIHTDIMKTEGLKQALDHYGFDAAFGGARRDEEKSRAKERIFSFRTEQHRWDPKNQRPELWKLYNARKRKGESIRVFPLSNWTELDIWQYIYLQNIPIVPLYFSAERPVVNRDGALIMVDDARMPLKAGEVPMMKKVRFRTLGCYPLTGAVESEAATLPEIIQEMLLTTTSERQGRVIDHDSAASMEKKKQEGYF
jgi:sulfate adenylyltransferase subunit 2